MKKLFYIYSVLSIWLICACTDQDNIRFDTVLEETTDALYDSVYVDKAEAEVVFTKLSDNFTFENRDLLSRTVISNNIASIVRNKRALAYVINLPNEGGFMIISGTKKYGPVLAYSEHGNFHYNDIPETPSDFWLESMLDKLSSQIELPVDSTEQYAVVWKDLLESTKRNNGCRQNCRSRYAGDYDMNELQMIMQDSIISWSQHGDYEIINLYEPLTGNESADIQYWKDTEQATYIVYENEWEQLTIGLKRPNGPSDYRRNETINTRWRLVYNSTFPYLFDEEGSYQPLVGSGALAAGQIMNYYQYPNYIDWSVLNSSEYEDKDNPEISKFLFKLCEDAGSKYLRGWTLCEPKNLANAIASYGYKVSLIDGFNIGSIPCILYGNLKFPSNSTPSSVDHYITVSGTMSLYFETRIAIYTFTGPKEFNECWHWIDYFYNHLNKVDWNYGAINDGWYDLNVNMNFSGGVAKSFKISKSIIINKP